MFLRSKFRLLNRAWSILSVLIATLALSLLACGTKDQKTVATIGDTKVSQATLNHWMGVVLGGDYRAALSAKAPAGLVSDPVNYPRCVSAAKGLVPKVDGKPKLTSAQVLTKCHQLNTAIREQALNYVLSVLWSREEASERGLRLPDAGEISKKLNDLIYNQFENLANFRSVIAGQNRSVSDVRFLIKRNILQTQVTAKLKAQAARLGGGEKAYYKLVLQSNAKWQSKTSCSPGYRAWECKQYGTSGAPTGEEAKPPAAVVLEYLAKGVA
jgi:hypothetical protein